MVVLNFNSLKISENVFWKQRNATFLIPLGKKLNKEKMNI